MSENTGKSNADSPRSLHCLSVSPLCFKNRTGRPIELVWLDYNGREVVKGELAISQAVSMNTYVTHPWKARDKQNGRDMLINFRSIYFPVEPEVKSVQYREGRALAVRSEVIITKPVYSLEEYCKQVIYELVSLENINRLPLPTPLLSELYNYCEENGIS
ncbi:von Hippel-Lindau tumor suppressor homolog [Nematostella vectensis]|uniref:von Hippel-Lindau tumor suppressor homolog n=1 Tax=Nematostella vectensis TaxID=45351 RepID=UPI0013902550|nr:von Hippel-Lindau tumor suppressor homolog [Nematostella vectensis]